jgi:hypothetical protein
MAAVNKYNRVFERLEAKRQRIAQDTTPAPAFGTEMSGHTKPSDPLRKALRDRGIRLGDLRRGAGLGPSA